jgi:hypothetical protein
MLGSSSTTISSSDSVERPRSQLGAETGVQATRGRLCEVLDIPGIDDGRAISDDEIGGPLS